MGLLRLWLALAVVLAHRGHDIAGLALLGGTQAVQLFYMISGFYMGLVLDRKYGGQKAIFWFNRLSRTLPLYLIVLALQLAYDAWRYGYSGPDLSALSYWIQAGPQLSLGSKAALLLSNLLVEGKDILCFFGLNASGHLAFIGTGGGALLPTTRFMFVPQAWSLGLEFMFYLLVPFLMKRSSAFIVALIAASLGARLLAAKAGYSGDPWSYRFFPFELSFFLLGTLAYRQSQGMLPGPASRLYASYGRACALAFAGFLLGYPWLPLAEPVKNLGLFLSFAIAMPWLFQKSAAWKFNNLLGLMSYALYISHLFVIQILETPDMASDHPEAWRQMLLSGLSVAALCLAFAWVLAVFIETPMQAWRQEWTRRLRAL